MLKRRNGQTIPAVKLNTCVIRPLIADFCCRNGSIFENYLCSLDMRPDGNKFPVRSCRLKAVRLTSEVKAVTVVKTEHNTSAAVREIAEYRRQSLRLRQPAVNLAKRLKAKPVTYALF